MEFDQKMRVSVEISLRTLVKVDALKEEWNMPTRGSVVNRLLEELLDESSILEE